MSGKERKRLVVLAQVKEKKLSLAAAARVMGLSYRQGKRLWARYRQRGDRGLVHRARGRPGPRRTKAALRSKILARVRERYPDFGPTLATEHLAQEGLLVDHETLRRWLIAEGHWAPGRPRRAHRAWRERRECFGQMVQMDGSDHDWFEGRRERAVLMVMIDDATNQTYAQFFEGETTRACYDLLEGWIQRHGLPGSLYVDRDSIYRCERAPTVAEQIAGEEPLTPFGRAAAALGVEVIMAHSPQAKGRVERRNGLLQDRLVKELRLEGISELDKGNEFLREKFLPKLNQRFTVAARSPADAHRPAASARELDAILSWQEQRHVSADWTVRWKGQWLQIAREHEALNLAGKKVTVRERRDGKVELLREGRALKSKLLPERPTRAARPRTQTSSAPPEKPAPNHPWRLAGGACGKEYFRKERAWGLAVKRAARLAAATASGPPSLRSGSPPAAAAAKRGGRKAKPGDIFG